MNDSSSNDCSGLIFSVTEAGEVVDVQNIQHIAEDKQLIGDLVEKLTKDWDIEKDLFNQQTGFHHQPSEVQPEQDENRPKFNEISMQKEEGDDIGQENSENVEDQEDNEEYGIELEAALHEDIKQDDEEEKEYF